MAPKGCLFFLICSCLVWLIHGFLPEPQNIRFRSVMFDSVLLWDPPIFNGENMTYTVQYQDDTHSFNDLCQRTYVTICNISSRSIYNSFPLRIRSEFKNKQSMWTNISFTPFKDTNYLPPTVHIKSSNPGVLKVDLNSSLAIVDGMACSLGCIYGTLIYKMKIWPEDKAEQVRDENTSITTCHGEPGRTYFHVISGLDPGRTYCLEAQVYIPLVNKSGEWSKASCSHTPDSGTHPALITVIILILLLLVSVCCMVIVCNCQRIKHICLPSYSLPQHVEEFLNQPSYSSQFLATHFQEDHNYETITVLLEEPK